MTKTLALLIGGIIVYLDEDGGGVIKSNLHDSYNEDKFGGRSYWLYWEHAIDGLESLILAHACAGIDILSKEYRKGVQTAIDAIENHCIDM